MLKLMAELYLKPLPIAYSSLLLVLVVSPLHFVHCNTLHDDMDGGVSALSISSTNYPGNNWVLLKLSVLPNKVLDSIAVLSNIPFTKNRYPRSLITENIFASQTKAGAYTYHIMMTNLSDDKEMNECHS